MKVVFEIDGSSNSPISEQDLSVIPRKDDIISIFIPNEDVCCFYSVSSVIWVFEPNEDFEADGPVQLIVRLLRLGFEKV